MRSKLSIALLLAAAVGVSACGKSGLDRDRPNEFAVPRQAPLVIPPDFALVPPSAGAPRPQDNSPADDALQALFGGTALRSASENAVLDAAGRTSVDPGVRSGVGSPETNVIDKGTTTRDIIAAPEGDGRDAKASTPQ